MNKQFPPVRGARNIKQALEVGHVTKAMAIDDIYLTLDQLKDMLDRQYDLNNAYNGSSWSSDFTFSARFRAAAMNEFAEFLQETNGSWDWYSKRKDHFDAEQAYFEAVDVVHFCLAAILTSGGIDWVKKQAEATLGDYENDRELMYPAYFGSLENVMKTFNSFWAAISVIDRNDSHVGMVCLRLNEFVAAVNSYLGFTKNDFHEAYIKKNQRNHDRVSLGVMTGVDVKKSEQPLRISSTQES